MPRRTAPTHSSSPDAMAHIGQHNTTGPLWSDPVDADHLEAGRGRRWEGGPEAAGAVAVRLELHHERIPQVLRVDGLGQGLAAVGLEVCLGEPKVPSYFSGPGLLAVVGVRHRGLQHERVPAAARALLEGKEGVLEVAGRDAPGSLCNACRPRPSAPRAARGPQPPAARGPHPRAARGPQPPAGRGPHPPPAAACGPQPAAARGPQFQAARGPQPAVSWVDTAQGGGGRTRNRARARYRHRHVGLGGRLASNPSILPLLPRRHGQLPTPRQRQMAGRAG